MKKKLLIIEDEPQMRKLLTLALSTDEYEVITADTGKLGLLLAANQHPDVILLDLQLPDMHGRDVLWQLREWYTNAIVILSVINNEEEIVSALDQGANDYLSKPFRMNELLARLRSALRRNLQPVQQHEYSCKGLRLNVSSHSVYLNNELIKLTTTEFQLLHLFMKHQGCVLTHHFILKEIWGVGSQNETHYLRVFIGTLRKKIEPNPAKPNYILTENGVGYRFTAPL